MTSRMQPYRQRIPTHIIQLLDVASRITLFLVGQSGPLCFTFKDRLQNKYKTSIGPEIKCTCATHRNDHCIHSLYILLKIFKVSVQNPIMWQCAYVDSQLGDLVAGKYTVNLARRIRPTFENIQENYGYQLPSENLKKLQLKLNKKALTNVEKMKIDQQSVCPICQDKMTNQMSLSYCKVKCGNNFHLQCLKVWAKHKQNEQSSITCPMCRNKFGQNYLDELEYEERQFNKRQLNKLKLEFNCSSCGVKNIPNNPHKCLLCTSFELCQPCYLNNKHIKHPFIRQEANGKWRGAQERRQNQLKIKNYIDNKKKQTYNDEILKRLRKIEEDPSKLIDYIASAYPYVSKYISENIDPFKKLDFNPGESKCFKCNSTKMIFLRRLNCGHYIDHECMKANILNEKFYCDEDGSLFLKGYQNLLLKQKQLENKRKQKQLQRPNEYNIQHIKGSQSYNFISEEPFEQPTLTQILTARNSTSSRRNSGHIGQRFTNNIIRNNVIQQRIESDVVSTNTRQNYPSLERPNREIRIRNVVNSVSKNKKSQNKRQKNINGLADMLIGRKLK